MRFDKKCKAVLFASAQSTFSAKALLNVLTGRANPSGKLACTCYDNTDEYFRTLRAYKDAGRNKVGTFYGYRHYDISGIKVKYPFGHGLSYSRFTCTSLQILGDVMNIAVKNVGYRAGAEVIQIYVGKDDSSIVRPKKELKTFFKVYLNPGQTQMLTIRLSDLDLTVWDKSKKRMVSELGSYEYYIGTSLSNVLQKGKFVAGKEVVEADQERYADYLQSFSNVKRGGFYLEEPIPEKKRSAGLKKAGLIWFFSMVCLDIFFAYFSFVRWIPGHWIINLVVFGLTLTPLIMAISGHAKIKKKIRKEQDISMKKKLKKREALNINDLADEIPYELLFEQEFSAPALEKEEKALVEKEEEDTAFLRHVPFDKEFTCAKIKDDFTTFAYERGITLDEESVRKLFSAFAASRLVILQCDDEERQATLLSVLGEYFATPISLDAVSGEGEDYDVRYKKTSDGEFALTNIAKGIIGKVAEENKIFTIAITNVQASSVKSALAPFVRFIDQPHKKAKILIRKNENSYEEGHDIPETTWIVLAMAGGEKFVDLPKYVLDMASIVPVRLQDGKKKKTTIGVKKKTEEVQIPVAQEQATDEDKTVEQAPQIELEETVVEEEKTLVKQLLYSQWNKLVEYACRDYQLDEALWKRVDRLKEYVNGYCAYTVENKQWQRMEKFVATYMAMGGNAENALDNVLAQLLINGVISALVESNKKLDEKFSHTLENIFGTGSVSVCLKALRDSGKNI